MEKSMENQIIKNDKDTTKEKIILFVIGVLVGAVISAGAFLISVNTLGANRRAGGMPGGTPPEMSNNQNGPSGQGGPNGQNNTNQNDSNNQNESNGNQNSQNSQPPEKPSNDSAKNNN